MGHIINIHLLIFIYPTKDSELNPFLLPSIQNKFAYSSSSVCQFNVTLQRNESSEEQSVWSPLP